MLNQNVFFIRKKNLDIKIYQLSMIQGCAYPQGQGAHTVKSCVPAITLSAMMDFDISLVVVQSHRGCAMTLTQVHNFKVKTTVQTQSQNLHASHPYCKVGSGLFTRSFSMTQGCAMILTQGHNSRSRPQCKPITKICVRAILTASLDLDISHNCFPWPKGWLVVCRIYVAFSGISAILRLGSGR